MMEITIRVVQVDGQAEVRINPTRSVEPIPAAAAYQQYKLTPEQLFTLARDAMQAYAEIRAYAEWKQMHERQHQTKE